MFAVVLSDTNSTKNKHEYATWQTVPLKEIHHLYYMFDAKHRTTIILISQYMSALHIAL